MTELHADPPELQADPLELLRARTSEKWRAYPGDMLPLFVAEMDYPLAEPIAEAIIQRVRASDTGYVGSAGPLAPAFATFAEHRWGWHVHPERVRTTTDVSVAIVETLRHAVAPGTGVIVTPPVYPPFFDLIPEAGGTVVEVPLLAGAAGDLGLDLDGIDRALAAGAGAILLCNPHNPLGLVHPASVLATLATIAERHGAIVVSDEIHGPLVHRDAAFTPYLTVSDAARSHGVCVTSASKGWNLAGVKCAIMVAASDRTMAIFDRMPVEVGFRTSLLGLHASVAAFTEGEQWLDDAVAAITRNRELLSTLVSEHLPGVGYRPPRASYLAWLDLRALGWGEDPSIRARDVARVALNPGPSFGAEGRGFARLNFACSPEVLTEAITRLASAMDSGASCGKSL